MSILVPSAQCLYVLTDDNTPAVEALHADGAAISSLLAIAQAANSDIAFGSAGSVEQTYSLRVLSCGMWSSLDLRYIESLTSADWPQAYSGIYRHYHHRRLQWM
jgi:hypothetical protein